MSEQNIYTIPDAKSLFTVEGIIALVNSNEVVERQAEEIFHHWVKRLLKEDEKLSIDNIKLTAEHIKFETSYPTWGGGREHGYYEMPIKYLISENYIEMIEQDVAVRDAEEEAERNRKVLDDQLRAEQAAEESQRKEREEYNRLHAIYGTSTDNEGKA